MNKKKTYIFLIILIFCILAFYISDKKNQNYNNISIFYVTYTDEFKAKIKLLELISDNELVKKAEIIFKEMQDQCSTFANSNIDQYIVYKLNWFSARVYLSDTNHDKIETCYKKIFKFTNAYAELLKDTIELKSAIIKFEQVNKIFNKSLSDYDLQVNNIYEKLKEGEFNIKKQSEIKLLIKNAISSIIGNDFMGLNEIKQRYLNISDKILPNSRYIENNSNLVDIIRIPVTQDLLNLNKMQIHSKNYTNGIISFLIIFEFILIVLLLNTYKSFTQFQKRIIKYLQK